MEWSEPHVKHWISWAITEFSLVGVNEAAFAGMTGKELCELEHANFESLVPHDKGDVFWTHIELLRKCKFVGMESKVYINNTPHFRKEIVSIIGNACHHLCWQSADLTNCCQHNLL